MMILQLLTFITCSETMYCSHNELMPCPPEEPCVNMGTWEVHVMDGIALYMKYGLEKR